jgi:hypothetical protein
MVSAARPTSKFLFPPHDTVEVTPKVKRVEWSLFDVLGESDGDHDPLLTGRGDELCRVNPSRSTQPDR